MIKYFTNNFSVVNLHAKPSQKSEIVTQMIYGDSFSISKKSKKWLKIKIKEDGYKGYIKNKNFTKYLKPTHKISVLKSKVYKFPNKRKKVNEETIVEKQGGNKKKPDTKINYRTAFTQDRVLNSTPDEERAAAKRMSIAQRIRQQKRDEIDRKKAKKNEN